MRDSTAAWTWRHELWPRRWAFVAYWFGTYGVAWAVLEPLAYFYPSLDLPASPWLWILLALGPVVALQRVWPKRSCAAPIAGVDCAVEVRIGDAFDQLGGVVIPCNRTFDIDIDGRFLVPHSLQGQLVATEFDDNIAALEAQVSRELDRLKERRDSAQALAFKPGKRRQYEFGTVVGVSGGRTGRRYYLVAMSTVNESGRAQCTASEIRQSLNEMWSEIGRRETRGNLVVPLMGTNMGRVAARRQEILGEILLSFVAAVRSGSTCLADRLTIVILPSDAVRYGIGIAEVEPLVRFACS